MYFSLIVLDRTYTMTLGMNDHTVLNLILCFNIHSLTLTYNPIMLFNLDYFHIDLIIINMFVDMFIVDISHVKN